MKIVCIASLFKLVVGDYSERTREVDKLTKFIKIRFKYVSIPCFLNVTILTVVDFEPQLILKQRPRIVFREH